MKFWLLTTEYPPFYGGGISTYCKQTAKMMADRHHQVTVFLCDRSIDKEQVEQQGCLRIVRFTPFVFKEKKFLGYDTLVSYAFAKVVEKYVLQEGKPDIIESQEYNGICYFTILFKKLLYPLFKDLKIVLVLHAPSFVYLPYNHVATYALPYFWIHRMEKYCISGADAVIAPSKYIVDEIHREFPELRKTINIIPNPFFNDIVQAKQGQLNFNEFVFYGKLSPLKGAFLLLEYFEEIWINNPEVKLRMIGGLDHFYHPEGMTIGDIVKKRYSRYIRNKQLILEGTVSPNDLYKSISQAHAVIVPSTVDNFPYAVLEGMWGYKVLLVSKSGGQAEIIENGVNGFIFDHSIKGSFFERIREIQSLSNLQLESIITAANKTVKEYCNPDLVYSLKEKLFRSLEPFQRDDEFPFLNPEKPDVEREEINYEYGNLLSVVIPYYNMGAYIEETIKSVLRSDYPLLEIILVNDGSTDPSSIEKLDLIQHFPQVYIVNKENEGLAAARNFGSKIAKGQFLAFLDADDLIDISYYSKAISILVFYKNVYFVGCWTQYTGNSTDIWPCFTPEPPFVLVHNMANTSALVYKKKAFLDHGLNDSSMIFGMEDYDSLLSILSGGHNGVVLPEVLFTYRVRDNSMARKFTKNKILYLYELIAKKHHLFFRRHASELSNLLNSNGPGYTYDNPTLDRNFIQYSWMKRWMGSKAFQSLRQNKYLRKNLIRLNKLFKKR